MEWITNAFVTVEEKEAEDEEWSAWEAGTPLVASFASRMDMQVRDWHAGGRM